MGFRIHLIPHRQTRFNNTRETHSGKMWVKQKTSPLLLGMQNRIATIEVNMLVLQIIADLSISRFSN